MLSTGDPRSACVLLVAYPPAFMQPPRPESAPCRADDQVDVRCGRPSRSRRGRCVRTHSISRAMLPWIATIFSGLPVEWVCAAPEIEAAAHGPSGAVTSPQAGRHCAKRRQVHIVSRGRRREEGCQPLLAAHRTTSCPASLSPPNTAAEPGTAAVVQLQNRPGASHYGGERQGVAPARYACRRGSPQPGRASIRLRDARRIYTRKFRQRHPRRPACGWLIAGSSCCRTRRNRYHQPRHRRILLEGRASRKAHA